MLVELLSLSISAGVAALRVHAVSGGNWYLVVPTLLFGLVPVGTNLFKYTRQSFKIAATGNATRNLCLVLSAITEESNTAGLYATCASAILSDILVVIVTWWYMSRSVLPYLRKSLGIKPKLTTVMLLDGTLYFVVLTTLNTINIIVFASTTGTHNISGITSTMATILTSHFLLHICDAADTTHFDSEAQTRSFGRPGESTPRRSWMSSVEFAPNVATLLSEAHTDRLDAASLTDTADGDASLLRIESKGSGETEQEEEGELEVPETGSIDYSV